MLVGTGWQQAGGHGLQGTHLTGEHGRYRQVFRQPEQASISMASKAILRTV